MRCRGTKAERQICHVGAPERSGDRTDEEYWHIVSTPAIMNINCHSILSSVPVVYEAVKGFGIYFRL
jgi:hypothetical protein